MPDFSLRPHHGLCIHFYGGKGYSKEFTDNMSLLISGIVDSSIVTMSNQMDRICSCCPNNKLDKCVTAEKVQRYDDKVLRLCGFHYGDKVSFKEFSDKIRTQILDKNMLYKVCSDCEWFCICSRNNINKNL